MPWRPDGKRRHELPEHASQYSRSQEGRTSACGCGRRNRSMKPPMNDLTKNILLWLVVAVIVVLAYQSLSPRLAGSEQQMSYSEFVQQVKNDNVSSITISANMPPVITGTLKDGSSLRILFAPPSAPAMLAQIESQRGKKARASGYAVSSLMRLIIDWLPLILVFGLLFYTFRQLHSGAGGLG